MSEFREKLLVRRDVKLKLYYYREDNKYEEWSALIWGDGISPQRTCFFEEVESSSCGQVTEVILKNVCNANRIYFAIGKLDRNNNFLERECAKDRFILTKDVDSNGYIEVYVIHGKEELQDKEKDILVNMHYRRWKKDYKDWDVHTWINGKKDDIKFSDDKCPYWKVASCRLSSIKPSDRLGFIIRRGGNKWLEKECREKVVNLRKHEKNGVVDVYMMQNIRKIVFDNPIVIDFHYKRYDDEYDGWNVWIWKKFRDGLDKVEPGCSVNFDRDDITYGRALGGTPAKIATYVLEPDEDLDKIGFLVRRGDWEDRDVDLDRFLEMGKIIEFHRDGRTDIYLAQDDITVGYREEDIDLSPKIVDARFRNISVQETKVKTIDVELNLQLREDRNNNQMDRAFVAPFVVKSEDGDVVPISSVQYRGEIRGDKDRRRFFRINLKADYGQYNLKPFDKRYILELEGYKSLIVSRRKLYDRPEYEEKLTYDGDDLGVTYSKTCSKFRVWAPEACKIELVLYEEGTKSAPVGEIELKRSIGGTWYREIPGDLEGMFYQYRVYSGIHVVEIIDPYAKAAGINAERAAIIDLAKTNPKGWEDLRRLDPIRVTDSIITEAHVRNYSIKVSSGVRAEHRGKFLGFVEQFTTTDNGERTCLSHIEEMGYTHVQLMPIAKCGTLDENRLGNQGNWGYDTVHFMVIEGTYSTNPRDPMCRILELKELIKGLKEKGIRVILDVVFNHTYKTQFSNLNILMRQYYHRVRGEVFSNATQCSNEIASERKMTRKYIIDSVKYWVNEFKVDGFRFDVMYLLDKDTLNRIREEVDRIDPSIILYGEGWDPVIDTTLEPSRLGKRSNAHSMPRIGYFSNEAADAIKGSFDGVDRGVALNGENIGNKIYRLKRAIVADVFHPQLNNVQDRIRPNQVINYVGVHDNLTLWDKISLSAGYLGERIMNKMYRLAYSILFTMQGALVVPEGDEFLRTKGGNANSYNAGDDINGIEWTRKERKKDDCNYIKGLIRMRKYHRGFRMDNPDEIRKKVRFMENMPENVIGYTINDHANADISERIAVVHNGSWREETIELPNSGWSLIVNDKVAGTEELERIRGNKVKVLAHSSVVLTD